MTEKHVYGPVPSRRFGLSLGVDLVPYKTCCFDCVYCQLGRTTELTMERREFVPADEILTDISESLSTGPRPDVITFAGSGEPTLYAGLGRLIEGIHNSCDVPVLLLTNGALLCRDEVAAEVMQADILAPSVDAGDAETFRRINRPHADLSFESLLQGIGRVAEAYRGRLQLEVMLTREINDSNESIQAIKKAIEDLPVESIDLNTPVRPPPDREMSPCSPESLEAACRAFGPRARMIASYSGRQAESVALDADEQQILEMISRRPCTVDDIGSSLGMAPNLVIKILDRAVEDGRAVRRPGGKKHFFFRNPD